MNYATFRPSIRSGDVIAYTHKGVRSLYDLKVFLVRLFTQSEYVHVAIAWVVGERVFLLEAVATGVRIYPLSKDLPFFHLTGRGLTDAQLADALQHVGDEYSFIECAKAYMGANNPLDDQWECAEYVASVLGLECKATPAGVVEHMLARGSAMIEIRS